jgi:2,4-didehydro-3-deoxy-L-rhamnonate hydrolase
MSIAYGLGRFRDEDGSVFTGVVIDESTVALRTVYPHAGDLSELLADWPRHDRNLATAVMDAHDDWAANARPVAGYEVLAPIEPPQIFQSGANYKTHVIQLAVAAAARDGADDLDAVREQAAARMRERAERGTPYVFIGLPSSICGPYADIVLPDTGHLHDWELELAAVIGSEAHRVSRQGACTHVAGYVIANDLTTRDRVFRPDMPSLGTDWLAGKNAPTFLPLGPWFVPARFVPDPGDVQVTLKLNGTVMQDASTSEMIFDVARLIEHVTAITPLRPGDLLLTGSPAGNGAHYDRYLHDGDVMEATITGLGTQRNRCVGP